MKSVAALDEFEFCGDGIYAVYHVIKTRQVDIIGVGRHIEHLVFMHDASPVDIVNPLLGNIYFMFPYCRKQGVNLAVDIRQANAVIIEEIQFSYTTAGEDFRDITAYTADPEYGYT
jgi:hypothetical protein